MRNIKKAWFPRPIRSDPSQRDPNLWCKYHGTNGHWTGDYQHLHDEVATLLKNEHLREFLSDRVKSDYGCNKDNREPSKAGGNHPCLMINMILGGNEINGVTFSPVKKMKKVQPILSNGECLNKPSYLKYHSSHKALRIRFSEHDISKGDSAAYECQSVIKTTLIEVVDDDMGFNTILGRPWLHEMKDVSLTYHQLLKFSTLEGIKQIREDQLAAREMNVISVSSSKGKEHAT
ncbi:uncharacterized protein [Nicotiana sylvestris]|uniref:uncharacterized protein n=1 Tax=Nicotiana sylvestris TaxID=4096 RepID=UPI00388CA24A